MIKSVESREFIEKYKQNVEKTINLFGGIRKNTTFASV